VKGKVSDLHICCRQQRHRHTQGLRRLA